MIEAMSTKAERLKAARLAAGFPSTLKAAERLGVSASTYRAHENGQNDFDEEQAFLYAKAFGADPAALIFGESLAGAPMIGFEKPNAIIGDRLPNSTTKIPLYGHAVAGEDGEFVLNGEHLDNITAPPSLSGVRGAYAVTVASESMEPRYLDGETVFVDPGRRVLRGDFVVAQIKPEQEGSPPLAYIKRFVRRNLNELVLEQYNPPKELRFKNDDVVSVHFIVASQVR